VITKEELRSNSTRKMSLYHAPSSPQRPHSSSSSSSKTVGNGDAATKLRKVPNVNTARGEWVIQGMIDLLRSPRQGRPPLMTLIVEFGSSIMDLSRIITSKYEPFAPENLKSEPS